MQSFSSAEGSWNYRVQYDPDEVTIERMLAAVSDLGYEPSRKGAVQILASGVGTGLRVGTEEADHAPGSDGKVALSFAIGSGSTLEGVVVEAEADGPVELARAEVSAGDMSESKTVEVAFSIPEDADPATSEIALTVRYRARGSDEEIRLRVPVFVVE